MCAGARNYSKGEPMSLESIVGLGVFALLLVYLAYALLCPEKF